MKDLKLTWGQVAVLVAAALPMAAVGVAGAVATYVNMQHVLHRSASALGLVAAGEGATLICALVALAVTLMGQHTPATVRLGMWLIPTVAAGAGYLLAPTVNDRVTMTITPLAMTAAGEGIAFVARRVVAYRTGVDIEQQRRSGLLLWHANRAANGSGLGKRVSRAAVWRLTKQFAATDDQMSVQLGSIQRYRIAEGADANLAAVLGGSESPAKALEAAPGAPALPESFEDAYEAHSDDDTPIDYVEVFQTQDGGPAYKLIKPIEMSQEESTAWIQDVLAEREPVRLMTGDDVAVSLNVKPGTVRSWASRGSLRVHDKDAHGRNLFHPDDVEKMRRGD